MGTLSIPCASRRQRHRGEGRGPVFHVEHWLFFCLKEWSRAPVARGQSAFALGLSSLLRAKREPEMVLAPVRGAERFFIKANCSLLMSKENQKTTSDFDALDPRERGCSPLSDPEGVVETEKS